MFESAFTPTNLLEAEQSSALSLFADKSRVLPPPGVYSDGVLSILDESAGATFLNAWRWLVGSKYHALLTTGFGDVYYWDHATQAVHFLNVQHAMSDFVDRSVTWVLNDFLTIPEIQENVLRRNVLARLVAEQRPLSYDECFILAPWQVLGGDETKDDFEIGKCSVYLDLVGQAQSGLKSF